MHVQLGAGREIPWGLRKLARQRDKSPMQLVVDAIHDHPTLDDAAAALDVTPETLRSWRRKLGIEVV